MDRATLVEKVRAQGIVGAGGAGFPTHVKLNSSCDTVIANGAECEPLLYSDKYLLETAGERIISALEMVVASSGASRGVIALKAKEKTVVQRLREQLKGRNLELFLLDDFYPAGDEHVLVHEVTGRVVPEGGIPLDCGVLVENVETLLNIHRAVSSDQAVTHRYLTCSGEVAKPSVVRVPIGISIEAVIKACGGAATEDYKVIIGGPMMGFIQRDIKAAVTKLTSGIIVLPSGHRLLEKKAKPLSTVIRQSKAACCQCSFCTELCPRYLLGHDLEPHRIMRQISLGLEWPHQVIENAGLCTECGLCEAYACVMELSPRLVNRTIKESLAAQGIKARAGRADLKARELRSHRKVPQNRLISRLQLEDYSGAILNRGVEVAAERVELLLQQHIGLPARALVRQGEQVARGQLLAEIPAGKLGARIHASISGTVTLVDQERIIISPRELG